MHVGAQHWYMGFIKHGRGAFRIATVASALLFAFAVLGCNTTEGIGEDIEATGEAIDDAAD